MRVLILVLFIIATYNTKTLQRGGAGKQVILGCPYSYEAANKLIKGDLYMYRHGKMSQDALSGISNQV